MARADKSAGKTADDGESLHPRFTADLFGHRAAERTMLDALASARLHHAWLITGPRGVGKATLAWRFARHILARGAQGAVAGGSLFGDELPADSLAMAPDHPVFHRVAALGHGNLVAVEAARDDKGKALREEITVDEIRRLHGFFNRTAAEPGMRIAIVDSADEMNRNAANALLKLLEEPPASGLLLVISHAPGGLLPTIRSRCRTLALAPLSPDEMGACLAHRLPEIEAEERTALAALALGAPGRALHLAGKGGLELYRELLALLATMPGLDIAAAHRLAGKLAPQTALDRYQMFVELLRDWLARMVRRAATGETADEMFPGEREAARRVLSATALDRQVELWEKTGRLVDRARAVHLDRKQVILDLLGMLDAAASGRPAA